MNKSRLRKTIVTLFSSALMIGIGATYISKDNNVTASDDANNYEVSFVYKGKNGSHIYYCNYTDELFFCNSSELNGDIAKLSIGLATEAYIKDAITTTLTDEMGFEIVRQENYEIVDSMTLGKDSLDIVAFTIAKKQIGNRIVYCVPIKGTSENAEWYSNFNLGTGDMHEGFMNASNQIYEYLVDVIDNDGYDDANTVILTTGHSRGAAVSNIVSGWLTKHRIISINQIFSYNFACPAVSKSADTSLNNIYNYNNPGDLVPLLPLESWGYKRYGKTIDYYTNDIYRENTYLQFNRITGTDCKSEISPSRYVSILNNCFATRESFVKPENKLLFRMIAFMLGKGSLRNEYRAVLSCDDYAGALALGWTINATVAESTLNLAKFDGFLRGYSKAMADKYSELLNFIDLNNNQIDEMDETTFKAFLINNSNMISNIETATGLGVTNKADLYRCRNYIYDTYQRCNSYDDANDDFVNLIFDVDEDNNFKTTIQDSFFDAHTGDFYILWMNTEYFGYRLSSNIFDRRRMFLRL